jgi:molybdopterin/thiamine biosynthesis adenylyltransferase
MDAADSEVFARQFYSRQTILEELGEKGQQRLAESSVAVVGVGGLGSVCSLYLALAGVGYIRVIDHDTVELHNLHRQILYNPQDSHQPKAQVAAKRLSAHNPSIQTEAINAEVNSGNVEALLRGVDAVVDCLDNFPTRYLVNRACVKLQLPYVFGAVMGMEGNLSVFDPPKTGCLECTMHNYTDNSQGKVFGIIGASAGIIGSLEAMETIKLLTGVGQTLKGKLLVCDFHDMNFTTIPLDANPKCPVCSQTKPRL